MCAMDTLYQPSSSPSLTHLGTGQLGIGDSFCLPQDLGTLAGHLLFFPEFYDILFYSVQCKQFLKNNEMAPGLCLALCSVLGTQRFSWFKGRESHGGREGPQTFKTHSVRWGHWLFAGGELFGSCSIFLAIYLWSLH